MLTAGTVVTEGAVHQPGWLSWRGGHLVDVAAGAPPRQPDVALPRCVVVPGFVDMHCHGGAGAGYDGTPQEALAALTFHRRHGTTTTAASLVSATTDSLLRSIAELTELVSDGELGGIHLEGPWLATARAGAHDPLQLRDPTPGEVGRLLRAGAGALRMVTLAPDRAGALDAIESITAAGCVAALGHTDAGFDETRAAIAAGARVATHLFNAMAPLRHRDPGPVAALIEDPRVTLEVIADGVHLHPAVVRHVIAAAGPGRVALVTDAMAAAGVPDGAYHLGALDVTVAGSTARLTGSAALAGSTTTMDAVFRRTVTASPEPRDRALLAAAAMASTTPARTLRLDDVGALAPTLRADAVVLDGNLQVVAVLRRGRWVAGVHPPGTPSATADARAGR